LCYIIKNDQHLLNLGFLGGHAFGVGKHVAKNPENVQSFTKKLTPWADGAYFTTFLI